MMMHMKDLTARELNSNKITCMHIEKKGYVHISDDDDDEDVHHIDNESRQSS